MSEGQNTQTVLLDSQPVELYKILKFEGLVASGAQAKMVIDDGSVRVNGEVETRRRRKIFHGDLIEFEGTHLSMIFEDVAAP
ncbi:MAG: RNA-binding S4 domain-containing protein [Granulosicoccus sp.]